MNRLLKVVLILGLLSAIPFLFWVALGVYLNILDSPDSPKVRLQSILGSDVDCTAPCWKGITPGLSTAADFDELVERSKPFSFRYIWLEKENNSYSWMDMRSRFKMALGLDDRDDATVKYILFHEDSDAEDVINLKVVIESLGLPDTYGARYVPHVHYIEGLVYYTVSLFYEEEGVIVSFSVPSDHPAFDQCAITLTKDMPIDRIDLIQAPIPRQKMEEHFRGLGGIISIQDWDDSWTIEAMPCRP